MKKKMDPAIDPERDLVKSKIMVLILDGNSETVAQSLLFDLVKAFN